MLTLAALVWWACCFVLSPHPGHCQSQAVYCPGIKMRVSSCKIGGLKGKKNPKKRYKILLNLLLICWNVAQELWRVKVWILRIIVTKSTQDILGHPNFSPSCALRGALANSVDVGVTQFAGPALATITGVLKCF